MLQATFNVWAILAAVVLKTDAEMKLRMKKAIGGDVASGVLIAAVLAYVVGIAAIGPFFGALTGLICWAGFAATASLSPTLFETRPIKAWALQNGYLALAYAGMGAILGGWR
jgi:hypothetical protein